MILERFERHDENLLPPWNFLNVIIFGILALGIILFSLGIGMLVYILFEGLD